MARFMLYASTCELTSVLTFSIVLARKCVAPIQALIVPNGCSTVCLRRRIMSGAWLVRSQTRVGMYFSKCG